MKTGSMQLHRTGATTAMGAGITLFIALCLGAVALYRIARRFAESQDPNVTRLGGLRGAILGVDKRTIMAAMGPPRATTGRGDVLADDTWYYPVDRARQVALAIDFLSGVARRTHILKSPQRRV